ncbi:DUF1249 domain-containing protein [Aeromonas enteropelogenes]|uniref:DUF1249 domain-containing protein n=1 Tax=Aeromonas enteropelogenes TaxID=29489 RepID=UPI001CC0EAED|nr:DUF1249 domain-containing protein [Aeromonas enteropelogenes]UAK71880.1 DUF1249 domain-containing protein [Aeromonas enteropelogenes]
MSLVQSPFKRYVPDLMSLQRTCEVNYMALMKLLPPGGEVGTERRYWVGNDLQFQLTVCGESRFTSEVLLSQHNPELPEYLQAQIEIRLYHDVRMAEVCATQQISRLQPRYDYPNKKMHQRDEKEQVNLFLAEWLKFCLRHGTSPINISS